MREINKLMARCEDYPCCGHGPAGDGGACPDSSGRFPCVECGKRMPKNASSSICAKCLRRMSHGDDREMQDSGFYDY